MKGALIYQTVPWAPGLEREQLRRLDGDSGWLGYVAIRTSAACMQLGIRKGFTREAVKSRLYLEPTTSPARMALELGMLEQECERLADEIGGRRKEGERG